MDLAECVPAGCVHRRVLRIHPCLLGHLPGVARVLRRRSGPVLARRVLANPAGHPGGSPASQLCCGVRQEGGRSHPNRRGDGTGKVRHHSRRCLVPLIPPLLVGVLTSSTTSTSFKSSSLISCRGLGSPPERQLLGTAHEGVPFTSAVPGPGTNLKATSGRTVGYGAASAGHGGVSVNQPSASTGHGAPSGTRPTPGKPVGASSSSVAVAVASSVTSTVPGRTLGGGACLCA